MEATIPRNGSGVASIVNTFTPLTTANANDVNDNFTDVASMITDSLPRDGQAGMTGQFGAISGTVGEPGISWNADPDTGFRRPAGDQMAAVCGGADVMTITATGTTFAGGATSNTTVPTVGDNLTNKTYVDAQVATAAARMPAGVVAMHAANTAPTGWLECDGAAVSRTTYAALFTAIGTTWGSGDGSTTFNVPDLRGEFVRGWDHGRGVDTGRAFASSQADDIKAIPDPWLWNAPESTQGFASGSNYTGRQSTQNRPADWPDATETRPRNVALMYIIKT